MRISRSVRRVGAVIAAVILLPMGASPASAEPLFVGWPAVLPAWTAAYAPSSQDACAAGRYSCVDTTIRAMQDRYQQLLNRCDHNAVFGLAYLRTTQGYARAAAEPGFFSDPRFVNHEDAVFAQFYFSAYRDWVAGRRAAVPAAWRIAFDAAKNKKVSGSGNLMLGMSAHVNRDLPYVLAGIGLVKPDGTSRKPDHDKVNVFLNRVIEPLLIESARRLDPAMDDGATPLSLTYTALFQTVATWREVAWRNAERLAAARTDDQRQAVSRDIEAYAASTARTLELQYAYTPPLTSSATRDAFCRRVN